MPSMSVRLFYIVGPSGSGKDSLIDYVRSQLGTDAGTVFAKRTITRPAAAEGEDYFAVTVAEFEALLAAGEFAMHWSANGLRYGIGREIRDHLAEGRTVVVNGSREYLHRARADFPGMQVVSVTAPAELLQKRLASRGRENAQATAARLARAASAAVRPGEAEFEIPNAGCMREAGEKLLDLLRGAGAGMKNRSKGNCLNAADS